MIAKVALILAMFLLSWYYAEFRRRRRLNIFGDPRLLGVRSPWWPEIVAATILGTAIVFTTVIAITPPSYENTNTQQNCVSFLLDGQAFDDRNSASRENWDSFESVLVRLQDTLEKTQIALMASSEMIEVLVPKTYDYHGFMLLFDSYKLDRPRLKTESIFNSLAKQRRGIGWFQYGGLSVVVTDQARSEIASFNFELPGSNIEDIIFFRLPTYSTSMETGYWSEMNGWTWIDVPQQVYELLESRILEARSSALSGKSDFQIVQMFALFAFIGLILEALFFYILKKQWK